MGKKRKAGGRPSKGEAPTRTKFDIEERFDDSEDEFQAGRDQILLDEAPEAKRRRRVAQDGMSIVERPNSSIRVDLTFCYRGGNSRFRRGGSRLR